MINSLYRWIFAGLGLSPISVGFFCSGASNFSEALHGLVKGVAVCIVMILLFSFWIKRIKKDHEVENFTIVAISQRRSGPTVYFLAYVLPIILGGSVTSGSCMVVVAILAFICFYSECEENNPIAKMLGYRFYDVVDSDGISILVMSRSSAQDLMQKKKDGKASIAAIMFDDGFYVHLEK